MMVAGLPSTSTCSDHVGTATTSSLPVGNNREQCPGCADVLALAGGEINAREQASIAEPRNNFQCVTADEVIGLLSALFIERIRVYSITYVIIAMGIFLDDMVSIRLTCHIIIAKSARATICSADAFHFSPHTIYIAWRAQRIDSSATSPSQGACDL